MKKIIPTLILFLALVSCRENNTASFDSVIASGDVNELRSKKTQLSEQLNTLNDQVKTLDSVIASIDKNERLPLVTTFQVNTQKFEHYLELQGSVATKQNVLIYPEMAGTLQRVYVKEGDKVKKGQLLATIDDGGMTNQVAQLRTQAALAKTTFERQKRLWDQKIGSEIQFLQAKTNYEAFQSNVQQAESQLQRSVLLLIGDTPRRRVSAGKRQNGLA